MPTCRVKAIYKKSCIVYDARVQKHNTITTRFEKKCGELANKLFSCALVRQVARCRFHACVKALNIGHRRGNGTLAILAD